MPQGWSPLQATEAQATGALRGNLYNAPLNCPSECYEPGTFIHQVLWPVGKWLPGGWGGMLTPPYFWDKPEPRQRWAPGLRIKPGGRKAERPLRWNSRCEAGSTQRAVSVRCAQVKRAYRTSLVVQRLWIWLPMLWTQFWSLVQEDPICWEVTKPRYHNYWTHKVQLLKPTCLEPVLCNKRSHQNEKPAYHNEM